MHPIYIWILRSIGVTLFGKRFHIYWRDAIGYLEIHSMEMLPTRIERGLEIGNLQRQQIDGVHYQISATVTGKKRFQIIWKPSEDREQPWTNYHLVEEEFRRINDIDIKEEKQKESHLRLVV